MVGFSPTQTNMIETIENGAAETPFMKFGDVIKIEMNDESGKSIFGTIEQKIVPYNSSNTNAVSSEKKTVAS